MSKSTSQSAGTSVPSASEIVNKAIETKASTSRLTQFIKTPAPSNTNQNKFITPMPTATPIIRTNSTNKCQFCDKPFVKEHALKIHLFEKCEKIPAARRRQLLQIDERNKAINNCKQASHTPFDKRSFDIVLKTSRFFVDLTNEAVSGINGGKSGDAAAIDFDGLKADLKKYSNAHLGVKRTPSKTIRCHVCNKIFLNCAEYATHVSDHQTNSQLN